jgi:phosphotransferase system HPr (HPr) family protein
MANILVVDDYNDTVESMAMWLKQYGHDVHVARDGYQAIEMARRQRPNYVLLDLGLPRLDGYQVASRLRQEMSAPPVIIAITGHGREEDRQRALAAGCDHHFLKPFDHSALIRLLSASVTQPDSSLGQVPSPGWIAASNGPTRTVRRQVDVINILGLHLRAADKFVRLARQFRAGVRVACGGRTASGKSILDLTALAAECGARLELEADGPDAEAALDALTGLVARRFDERE